MLPSPCAHPPDASDVDIAAYRGNVRFTLTGAWEAHTQQACMGVRCIWPRFRATPPAHSCDGPGEGTSLARRGNARCGCDVLPTNMPSPADGEVVLRPLEVRDAPLVQSVAVDP